MQILLPPSEPNAFWFGVWHEPGHADLVRSDLPLAEVRPRVETVLVVPWSWLSWHRVTVPPQSHRQLGAISASLLEESVLQPCDQLHLCPPPDAHQVARSGGDLWIAVCDQARLAQAWEALVERGATPQRIVPEFEPLHHGVHWHWVQSPRQAWRVCCDAQGVMALALDHPFSPDAARSADTIRLTAEPGLAREAEHWIERAGLSVGVNVQDAKDRLLAATRSSWNLAQGPFKPRTAWHQRLAPAWRWLRHDPQAGSLRWALVALVGIQAVGWGAAAIQDRSERLRLQASVDQAFAQALPNTPQLDAPAQMAQALRRLEQQHGVASPHDLPALLFAWGQLMASHPVRQFNYEHDVLQVQGLSRTAIEAARSADWGALGLQAHLEDTTVNVRVKPAVVAGHHSPSLAEQALTTQTLLARIRPLRDRQQDAAAARAALQALTPLPPQLGEWRFTTTQGTLTASQVSAQQLAQWLNDWPAHARVSVATAQGIVNGSQWQVQLGVRLPSP